LNTPKHYGVEITFCPSYFPRFSKTIIQGCSEDTTS
jgi:hypothetical protein